MKVILLTICFFITVITSANSATIYNCIDRDGKINITDRPQEGMKCDSKINDSNMESLPKEQMKQKYEQIEKTKPTVIRTPKGFIRVPDARCLQEYMQNIDKKCEKDVVNKIRSSLSPHCREFVESSQKKEEPYKDCLHEFVMAANRSVREVEKCSKLPVDSKCKAQIQSAIRLRLWQATKEALKQ